MKSFRENEFVLNLVILVFSFIVGALIGIYCTGLPVK